MPAGFRCIVFFVLVPVVDSLVVSAAVFINSGQCIQGNAAVTLIRLVSDFLEQPDIVKLRGQIQTPDTVGQSGQGFVIRQGVTS